MVVGWFWQRSFWTDWRGWLFAIVVAVLAIAWISLAQYWRKEE